MSRHLHFARAASVGGHFSSVPTCPHCGSDNLEPSFMSSSLNLYLTRCRNCGKTFQEGEEIEDQDEKNRFTASIPVTAQRKIASMGLLRVAGNVYECPSTQDFWQVTGGGKILRLSGDEVDNGESIPAAPQDKPMEFLSSILDDLSF